jgi:ABC-type transport system substrate-binding protein
MDQAPRVSRGRCRRAARRVRSGKYTPYLAQSVTVVDARTIKVVLRSDAMFDNGQPVTAADAKATLDTMKKNSVAGTNNVHKGMAYVDGADVIDAKTYQIRLNQDALGQIFELLVGRETFVVPASAGASQNTKPIGNGAFKFVSYTPGQTIVYEKSPTFFDQANVHLKGVTVKNLVEGTPQANALAAGDIDLTSGVAGGLDINSYNTLKNNGKFGAAAFTASGFMYLTMCKTSSFIFNDVRVRQALEYGTDRAAVAAAVTRGLGAPATQFWPKSSPNYNAKVAKDYAYNPKKAARLLSEAGIKQGAQVDMYVYNAIPAAGSSALVLKDQWSKIGLNVNILISSNIVSDFNNPALAGTLKVPTNVTQFVRTAGQMMPFLLAPTSTNNTCKYTDAQIDPLIDQTVALKPGDPALAAKWQQLSTLLAQANPVMPLTFLPTTTGWSARIGGVTQDILGRDGFVATRYDQLYVKAKA